MADVDYAARLRRLERFLEEDFRGHNFGEWWDAEGLPTAPERFAMIDDTGTYSWVQFGDSVEHFDDFFSEGFEPVAVVDLDTGDKYDPVLRWRKAGKAHAIDCDMGEDCRCGAGGDG